MNDVSEVDAAHDLLNPNEIPGGIFQVVAKCLKDVKKLKTSHSVKMVTKLITVTEYVKLHEKYCKMSGHFRLPKVPFC